MKQPELHPCPCCPATYCDMRDSCYGCEEYAVWLRASGRDIVPPKRRPTERQLTPIEKAYTKHMLDVYSRPNPLYKR